MNSPWQYFTMEELTCHCGCGRMEMDKEYMALVVAMRRMTGIVMPLSSAYRCPAHNNDVSKTGTTGPHTTGRSVDPKVSGTKAIQLIQSAPLYGMTGIGVHQKGPYNKRFIHLDNLPNAPGQPRPHIWTY